MLSYCGNVYGIDVVGVYRRAALNLINSMQTPKVLNKIKACHIKEVIQRYVV